MYSHAPLSRLELLYLAIVPTISPYPPEEDDSEGYRDGDEEVYVDKRVHLEGVIDAFEEGCAEEGLMGC